MTSNILSILKVYGLGYKETARRTLTAAEAAPISHIEVVKEDYEPAFKIYLKEGGWSYITVSRNSSVSVGQTIPVDKLVLIELTKTSNGETNIILRGDVL